MAQSVSNDALWEKLSEVDKKLERLFNTQKPSNLESLLRHTLHILFAPILKILSGTKKI